MPLADKIAVVIPCLNEARTIARLVSEVKKILPTVIVVDDGSIDGTEKLADDAGAEVLRHERTQGKGMALNIGLNRARAKGFIHALVMDGDGQHAPSDIPKFLETMGKAPLIIGNRMANPERMPGLRRFVNRWMSRRLSQLAGQNLPDTQCGFRLIALEPWSRLNLQTTHFETESEMLLAFIASGHPLEFVPIEVIYKNERSKIHPLRDTVRWFKWYLKIRKSFGAQTRLQVQPAEI
jgi:glycosyltransferase involved in cell wall biosynthesis